MAKKKTPRKKPHKEKDPPAEEQQDFNELLKKALEYNPKKKK